MSVSCVPQKQKKPISKTLLFGLKSVSESHLPKAISPICFSEAGAVKDLSPDFRNAKSSMISNPSPVKVTYFSFLQDSNALVLIHLTLLGIVISLKPVSAKHYFPMHSKCEFNSKTTSHNCLQE